MSGVAAAGKNVKGVTRKDNRKKQETKTSDAVRLPAITDKEILLTDE